MANGIENIAYNNGLLRGYFKRVGKEVFKIFEASCPYDTGALMGSIKLEYHTDDMGFDIIIDKDYMVYTNETWISPKWNGKKNPNETWFNDAFALATDYIGRAISGNINEDYSNMGNTERSDVIDKKIVELYGEKYSKNYKG